MKVVNRQGEEGGEEGGYTVSVWEEWMVREDILNGREEKGGEGDEKSGYAVRFREEQMRGGWGRWARTDSEEDV